jgi:hypothetical protein
MKISNRKFYASALLASALLAGGVSFMPLHLLTD